MQKQPIMHPDNFEADDERVSLSFTPWNKAAAMPTTVGMVARRHDAILWDVIQVTPDGERKLTQRRWLADAITCACALLGLDEKGERLEG